NQAVHLGRAEIVRVDCDDAAAILVVAALLFALALPGDAHAELPARGDDEFAHGVLLARGDHEVLGFALLQDQPLRLDVLARVAPVALRFQVAEVEALLHAQADARERPGDLPADECLAANGRLVVEQDAV